MKIISVVFTCVIIAWALLNGLLILGTSHSYESIDWDYKAVVIASLVVFPVTGILLYQVISPNKRPMGLYLLSTIFLVLTGLIFTYYTFELLADEYSDLGESLTFALIPLTILAVNGFFVVEVIKKIIINYR